MFATLVNGSGVQISVLGVSCSILLISNKIYFYVKQFTKTVMLHLSHFHCSILLYLDIICFHIC